jgi:small-conductance mechanosensitive channel
MPKRCLALASLTLAAWVIGTGAAVAQAAAPGAAADAEIATAPVELDGVVLFRVRGVSSLPAEARARLIHDRVVAVAGDTAIPVDAIHWVETPETTRIVAGDRAILTVTDADAALEQVGRGDLAITHVARLRAAVAAYRQARSPGALRRGIVNAAGATVALAAALLLLRWFWRWLDRLLTRRLHARIHGVGIQSFELMRAEQIRDALRNVLVAIRTVLVLVATLVYLGIVLAQFPLTWGISRDLAAFVLAPLQVIGGGIVANIPSLVFLLVLFLVVRVALRVIRLFFDAVGRGTVTLERFEREWAQPTYKIVRLAIVAFALIVAYPYIPGSQSDAFKGITLFMGILFSLGSTAAISNIIAGYMITYRRAFKLGDRVRIGNAVGEVVETRLQVTHLRSPKNEEIVIPNSQILAGEVLNYSSLARAQGLILHTEVGIGYETPWRQVEAMLLMAAGRTAGLAQEPRPFVLLKKLADFAVTYELNAYCHDVRAMIALYTELHRHILDVFNEYGVQIMTPAYEGDPAEPKVVSREAWYTAPAAPVAQQTATRVTTPAADPDRVAPVAP